MRSGVGPPCLIVPQPATVSLCPGRSSLFCLAVASLLGLIPLTTRSVALAELEALRSRREQIERLEDDAHVLLKHYAWMVPETLDRAIGGDHRFQPQHSIDAVVLFGCEVVEVTGVFGGPLETSAHRSTKSEVTWLRIPEVDRTHGIGFRAFLTDNGIERLELTKA
jgi:hypothetical protein